MSTLPLIPFDASNTALRYPHNILTILPSPTTLHLLLSCLNVPFSILRSFLSNSHAPPNHSFCIACLRESAHHSTKCPTCILYLISSPSSWPCLTFLPQSASPLHLAPYCHGGHHIHVIYLYTALPPYMRMMLAMLILLHTHMRAHALTGMVYVRAREKDKVMMIGMNSGD